MKETRRKAAESASRTQGSWLLSYLDVAAKEGRRILNDDQYAHIVQQFELLVEEDEPTRAAFADIRPLVGEEFLELREKGGLLGKINLRVFFAVVAEYRRLAVLGVYKKKEDGKLAGHVRVRMRSRLRYVRGIWESEETGDGTRAGAAGEGPR